MSTSKDSHAHPYTATDRSGQIAESEGGLTAIEYACIELRIPESGNDWLDKLIAKAERRDLAAKAMQGAIASSVNDGEYSATRGATWSVEVATALQSELKKDSQC